MDEITVSNHYKNKTLTFKRGLFSPDTVYITSSSTTEARFDGEEIRQIINFLKPFAAPDRRVGNDRRKVGR